MAFIFFFACCYFPNFIVESFIIFLNSSGVPGTEWNGIARKMDGLEEEVAMETA